MSFATTPVVNAAPGDGKTIALKDSWDSFWSALTGEIGAILMIMSLVGVLLIAGAFIKWAWDRRRGGGGGGQTGGLWGALLVGCILSAPNLLIPAILLIFDVIANGVASLWDKQVAPKAK